ncbi:hypothetical protein B0J14DRAFT_588016 [Halenospora varia]|nr:hypothetical protein B0J14DRAFT_588016 [Halenospora varia]
MTEIISRLVSSSSTSQLGTQPTQTFTIRRSPNNPEHTLIHPIGYPADVPPLYTIISSSTSKPNIYFYLGTSSPSNKIGYATLHSLSSTTDLSLRNQAMKMKKNDFTGSFALKTPTAGKLKWSPGQIMGSSLALKDGNGVKIARLRSGGFPGSGEKKLEIFVPCREDFLEVVVLSGWAAKMVMRQDDEVASEVIQAVAGA